MRPFGYTLICAAVLMHFCFCEWDDHSEYNHIVGWIHAKDELSPTGAGFWGLVVPAIIAGGGVAMILHVENAEGRRKAVQGAKPRTIPARLPAPPLGPPPPPIVPTVVENPKLKPCPDCGRMVSRLAPSCPQCGRPLEPQSSPKAEA